jgi:hypothetical protein
MYYIRIYHGITKTND